VTDSIAIPPIEPFRATIRPPGSKSLTNRALLLAALADGKSIIRHSLIADDTQRMLTAIGKLGFEIRVSDPEVMSIRGNGGAIPSGAADLNLGNAGTTYRFLTAACCLGEGTYTLDGVARMRQRPISQLVEPLRQLGGSIDYLNEEGFPPLRITGSTLEGGDLAMTPTLSSQYISALLQIAPYCRNDLNAHFNGPVTSRPYIDMTLGLMSVFGVNADIDANFTQIQVAAVQRYQATEYMVEPDASTDSYL